MKVKRANAPLTPKEGADLIDEARHKAFWGLEIKKGEMALVRFNQDWYIGWLKAKLKNKGSEK